MSDPPDTATPRLAAKVRLKWDDIRQKPLLLFPEGVLVLNQTAHEVVALCDGQRTVAEIVKTLGEKFGSDMIDRDVKDLLARLIEKGLMTAPD
ncbi:MAG TPA: pyrroloquinoline quinone biosynthesis peptide chaperone PqqD [Candidatus Acidoferrales bacterium]|nr:pyrroloquinoline quinone biosynthesis peptide chaperone PqqD [Candidatus Acidoferrales bacterium]